MSDKLQQAITRAIDEAERISEQVPGPTFEEALAAQVGKIVSDKGATMSHQFPDGRDYQSPDLTGTVRRQAEQIATLTAERDADRIEYDRIISQRQDRIQELLTDLDAALDLVNKYCPAMDKFTNIVPTVAYLIERWDTSVKGWVKADAERDAANEQASGLFVQARAALARAEANRIDRVTAEEMLDKALADAAAMREAAEPIVKALEDIGNATDWVDDDETDRVYPWYEIEPLKKALAPGPGSALLAKLKRYEAALRTIDCPAMPDYIQNICREALAAGKEMP